LYYRLIYTNPPRHHPHYPREVRDGGEEHIRDGDDVEYIPGAANTATTGSLYIATQYSIVDKAMEAAAEIALVAARVDSEVAARAEAERTNLSVKSPPPRDPNNVYAEDDDDMDWGDYMDTQRMKRRERKAARQVATLDAAMSGLGPASTNVKLVPASPTVKLERSVKLKPASPTGKPEPAAPTVKPESASPMVKPEPTTPDVKPRFVPGPKELYLGLDAYDSDEFQVQVGGDEGPVVLHSNVYKKDFKVPRPRIGSALKNLHHEQIQKVLIPNSCRCSRGCHSTFSSQDVLDTRMHYLSFNDQGACSVFITNEITRLAQLGGYKYYLSHTSKPLTQVCSLFFRRAYGFSSGKLQECRIRLGSAGVGTQKHGNSGKVYSTKKQCSTICRAFWVCFYDLRCQKPSEDMWLSPTNLTHQYIYNNEFLPFCKRSLSLDAEHCPRRSAFEEASRHDDFNYIKKRARHRHLRCGVTHTRTHARTQPFFFCSHPHADMY
jgi:hypothetical protein